MTRTFLILLSLLYFSMAGQKNYDRLVDSLQRAGKTEELIPYFLKEIRSKPKNETALRWLGFFYLIRGDASEGEKYYREALMADPNCARCYMNIAKACILRKEYPQALRYFDQAIALAPDDPELYASRAQFREMGNDRSATLADYNKAVRLDPNSTSYLIKRGVYNAAQGYFTSGLSDVNKAIEIDSANYNGYFQRASLYYGKHMLNEAFADISRAMLLDSNHQELYTGRGAIFSMQQDYPHAISDYSKAIALNPNDYMSYYNRSLAKYRMEDLDGSCEDIHAADALLKLRQTDEALQKELAASFRNYCDSNSLSYFYQRGIAAYNTQHYEKAITQYNRGLAKFPGNAISLSFRGNAFYMLGNYPKALADYSGAIDHKDNILTDIIANQSHTGLPDDSVKAFVKGFLASLQISIAESHFALHQAEEALKEINKGIELAPDINAFGKENYYNLRGYILLSQGKYKEALDDFDRCLVLNPSFAYAYVNRALARISLSVRIKSISYTIMGSSVSQLFYTSWDLPGKTPSKKAEISLMSALSDCNKAIDLDPLLSPAYYTRAQIKKMLKYDDFCMDLLKAKELKYPLDAGALKDCGEEK